MTFSRATSRSEEPMRASLFSRLLGALTLALMVLTTATAWAQGIHDYIDENGNPNSHGAVVLSSDMSTIGQKGEMTWYVVTRDINYDDMLTIKGDVNLILYDGKTMTVDGKNKYNNGISLDGTLTIYGQTNGTGTLTVNGYFYGIYTEDEKCDLTICGGTVTATGTGTDGVGIDVRDRGSVTFSGST